jgi:hypothetical protein
MHLRQPLSLGRCVCWVIRTAYDAHILDGSSVSDGAAVVMLMLLLTFLLITLLIVLLVLLHYFLLLTLPGAVNYDDDIAEIVGAAL